MRRTGYTEAQLLGTSPEFIRAVMRAARAGDKAEAEMAKRERDKSR